MNGRGRACLLACVVLLVLSVGAVEVAAHADGSEGGPSALDAHNGTVVPADPWPGDPEERQATTLEHEDVVVEIHVAPDGRAAWTVEYRVRLADEESTEAFETVEEDVAANPEGYVSGFAEQVNASVAAASDRVGREMSAHGYAVSTSVQSIPAEYGIVRYTFDWESFARADDERLVVGDAVAGFVLDANTRLVVAWPSALALERAVPDPDERRDRAVVWNGRETDFVASEPVVELRRTDGAGGPAATGTDTDAVPFGAALVAGVLVVALAAATLGVVRYRSRRNPADAASERSGTTSVDQGSADGRSDTPRTGGAVDEDLLSNEERVLGLVERNGGRIKQQDIAERFEWTDAKTSRVVSKLKEADDVDVYRLGRENVVQLGEESDI